jgi:nitrogen-specific signal transduction histidine kinase
MRKKSDKNKTAAGLRDQAAVGMAYVGTDGRFLRVNDKLSAIVGDALVAIRDLGPGIPEGWHEKVFEAFWTTKPEGLGIGLMISRSIVESHNGRLWFENSPDQGVTFYFTLPLIIDPDPAGPRPAFLLLDPGVQSADDPSRCDGFHCR